MKRKGKFRMIIAVIAGVIIVVICVGGAIGWSFLSKERNEAENLHIAAIDFKNLKDGTYTGEYEGGMYKWRASKVEVTVASGKVKDIKQISASSTGCVNADSALLYNRVIEAQSLQVDTVSGATLTSKAYLKAVEDALVKAQKK
ncbi:MAG: FMN-binding protein [Caulobacteraceae bacterium]